MPSADMLSSVQSLSRVQLFATPWITAHQASLSSPTPRVYSNSCPSNRWCHPAISSSFVPFSSCSQSLPVSESFPVSQLFTWGGQSIGVSASASVLPMNVQDLYPLGWTLKWTGIGEFKSDDHYIYYCLQESLRRNGVALKVLLS